MSKTAQTICPHCGYNIEIQNTEISLEITDKVLIQLYFNKNYLEKLKTDIRLTQEGLTNVLNLHQPQVAKAIDYLDNNNLIIIVDPLYVEGAARKRMSYVPSRKGIARAMKILEMRN